MHRGAAVPWRSLPTCLAGAGIKPMLCSSVQDRVGMQAAIYSIDQRVLARFGPTDPPGL